MARSLTIKHEEKAATSKLFNLFILLALGWMAFAAYQAGAAADASSAPSILELR